jgi:hypothetical protein
MNSTALKILVLSCFFSFKTSDTFSQSNPVCDTVLLKNGTKFIAHIVKKSDVHLFYKECSTGNETVYQVLLERIAFYSKNDSLNKAVKKAQRDSLLDAQKPKYKYQNISQNKSFYGEIGVGLGFGVAAYGSIGYQLNAKSAIGISYFNSLKLYSSNLTFYFIKSLTLDYRYHWDGHELYAHLGIVTPWSAFSNDDCGSFSTVRGAFNPSLGLSLRKYRKHNLVTGMSIFYSSFYAPSSCQYVSNGNFNQKVTKNNRNADIGITFNLGVYIPNRFKKVKIANHSLNH